MARGGFSRRRGPAPVKLYAILAGVALIVIVGALFWFAGQAESRKPEQVEIRVPATNIGPDAPAPAPAGGGDAPSQ
jgi:hypothetical protein